MLDKILDVLFSKKGAIALTFSAIIALAFCSSCSGVQTTSGDTQSFSCSAIANCMTPETCGSITGNAAESGCAAIQCGCSFIDGCAENVDTEEVTSSLGCAQTFICDSCNGALDCLNAMSK